MSAQEGKCSGTTLPVVCSVGQASHHQPLRQSSPVPLSSDLEALAPLEDALTDRLAVPLLFRQSRSNPSAPLPPSPPGSHQPHLSGPFILDTSSLVDVTTSMQPGLSGQVASPTWLSPYEDHSYALGLGTDSSRNVKS